MADDIFEGGEPSGSNAVSKTELLAFVERVERLEDEKKKVADQIAEVKAEAKSKGYSPKALNAVLSLRKKDENTLSMIGHYADVLGVFG